MNGTGTVALGSTTFAMQLTQAPPTTVAALFGGLSRTVSTLGPLPLPIGGSCAILVSPDASVAFVTSATGTVNAPFPIPATPTLSGLDVFFQWAVLDSTSASVLGVTVSEGGALQL